LKKNILGNEIIQLGNSRSTIEVEDQKNIPDHTDGYNGVGLYSGWCLAQEFIPTKKSLSKISLIIYNFVNPASNINITVSIKDSLNGDSIASKKVDVDLINSSKVVFDIPDIEVVPNTKYYIVLNADKSNLKNIMYWGYTTKNKYENGEAWYSNNCQNWYLVEDIVQNSGIDFGFTSYWIDYGPEDPVIDGPTDGKAQEFTDYYFYTTDPEGNNVRYYIEWGDGIEFKWIGPYESGEIVTKSHSWASKGNYTIRVKARDTYGAESDWAELEVSMPKTKTISSLFLIFLEKHQHLFPLIRQILGL
jgi:hypothetical protein